ncbi:hypothetical protein GCM10010448_66060 [Streptomyces glomeratus]|uniref:Uncharacterized protein n=1 Tax=Streptomyces glomeratus TaxID=284452 RepID=A0ABP6M5P2_9ACTN
MSWAVICPANRIPDSVQIHVRQRQGNKKHCIAYMSWDSLPPCALAGQPLELPQASPDLAKLLLKSKPFSLARELPRAGHRVGVDTVADLLREVVMRVE